MNTEQKMFLELYEKGFRFISPEQENTLNNGFAHIDESGNITGFTLRKLKRNAAAGKGLIVDGKRLTEKEVDMMFNYIGYMRSISKIEKSR